MSVSANENESLNMKAEAHLEACFNFKIRMIYILYRRPYRARDPALMCPAQRRSKASSP